MRVKGRKWGSRRAPFPTSQKKTWQTVGSHFPFNNFPFIFFPLPRNFQVNLPLPTWIRKEEILDTLSWECRKRRAGGGCGRKKTRCWRLVVLEAHFSEQPSVSFLAELTFGNGLLGYIWLWGLCQWKQHLLLQSPGKAPWWTPKVIYRSWLLKKMKSVWEINFITDNTLSFRW